MVAFRRTAFCTEAEPYYYDFVFGANSPAIPRAVADHLQVCRHCIGQMYALRERLAEAEAHIDPSASGAEANVVETLSRHFEYVGEPVTCTHVKPFVPALLIPSTKIRIPTPITVHIDHCSACADDLEAIDVLELEPEQLARLGRLYAEGPNGDPLMCRRARSGIAALNSVSLEGIDVEVLSHLCVCPRCRARLYAYREALLDRRRFKGEDPGSVFCGAITATDLFDYVVPYGRAIAGPSGGTDPDEAIALHLRACPECLEQMQSLHRTVYGVAERADSETATVYTTKDRVSECCRQTQGLYRGYPVDVKVVHREPQPAARRDGRRPAATRPAWKHMGGRPRFKPLAGTVLLAASVMITVVFLATTHTAVGTDALADVKAAYAKTTNVHVTRLSRGRSEPLQEFWFSRSEDRFLIKTRGEAPVLYDLRAEERIDAVAGGGWGTPAGLSEEEADSARLAMDTYRTFEGLGLPRDAQVRPLADGFGEGMEAYEVTYTRKTLGGRESSVLWRVFADPATKLPRRVERFPQRHVGTINEPATVYVDEPHATYLYDYLTQEQIDAEINAGWREDTGLYLGPQRGL